MKLLQQYTDEELVGLMKQDQQEALGELYTRYQQKVWKYVSGLITAPDLAEDLVHDVFVKLWEVRDRIDLHGQFSSYLFRTCHNKVVDNMRRILSDKKLFQAVIDHYQKLSNEEEAPEILTEEMKPLMDEAMKALTPQQSAVYQLCKIQGKTYQQAGDELGISPNTVKNHMIKALETLRGYMRQHIGLIILMEILKN